MTKCENIIVNAAIAAGDIREYRWASVKEQVMMRLQSMRERNKRRATPRYCVEMLNGRNYTDSLPRAKRWALQNRPHVRQDVLGWWSNENLKVKDSLTGVVLWKCDAWPVKSLTEFDWN